MNIDGRRLRAVLVNYNGGSLLRRAVESILAATWPGPVDVVVVDNDSHDDSLGLLADFDDVHIIHRDSNEGFGANNHGIADLLGNGSVLDLPEPDLVLLLNPDAIVRPDALEAMAGALDPDRNVGAVAPRIIFDRPFSELPVTEGDITITGIEVGGVEVTTQCHPVDGAFRLPGATAPIWRCPAGSTLRAPRSDDGAAVVMVFGSNSNGRIAGRIVEGPSRETIAQDELHSVTVVQNAGSRLGSNGVGENRGFAEVDGAAMAPADAPAWCGAAVLLSADYLRDIGGFEPSYFLYYEDIDLSLRGLARGWSTGYEHRAIVEHRHSDKATQGTRQVEVLQHRNRLLMLARNAPVVDVLAAFGKAVLTPASLLVSSFRDGDAGARRRLAGWRLRSLVDAIRMLPGAISGRRALQRHGKRSPRDVMDAAVGTGRFPFDLH